MSQHKRNGNAIREGRKANMQAVRQARDMTKESDMLLIDLGYDPKQWRQQIMDHYKIMCEGKKFYCINSFIGNTDPKIISYEPWEGQRP